MARVIFVLVVVAAVPALPDGPAVLVDAADAMTRLTALILTVMLLSSVLGRAGSGPDLRQPVRGPALGPLLSLPGHGLFVSAVEFRLGGVVGPWWAAASAGAAIPP